MDWPLIVIQFLNGLQLGVLLFLLASGLTLVFGIMDFVNLAHGSLYMVGAFIFATLTQVLGSFVVALLLTLPLVALVGIATEILVVRHLYSRDHLDHVLATFGLILCFDTLVQMIWGPAGIGVALPSWLWGVVEIAPGAIFPFYRLVIIVVGLAIAAALYYVVNYTRLGMLIRAGASNRTMLSALGVDVKTLFTLVFAMGTVLAGLVGEASIGMGNDIIIVAFVVIIVGGIGSMKGAFIAAIMIGLIDTLGRAFLDDVFLLFMPSHHAETGAPAVSAMLIYILMAVILAFRPQGLFPPRVR